MQEAVRKIAPEYPVKRVSFFGSYAEGRQTEGSDPDIMIEFTRPSVSLIMLCDIKNRLEDELHIAVDVVRGPLPEDSFLSIRKVAPVSGQ